MTFWTGWMSRPPERQKAAKQSGLRRTGTGLPTWRPY